jgi:hypothetical protein
MFICEQREGKKFLDNITIIIYFLFLRKSNNKGNKMNYELFRQAFEDRILIPTNDILKRFPDFDTHRLTEWQDKGYIQKVINRFYVWQKKPLDDYKLPFIANRIYTPSYISLKSALRWYNFIPEGVFQQFSVTTRKTKNIETPIGDFRYKNVNPNLFFGYYPVKPERGGFLIAEPEKALLDNFYLYPQIKDELDIDGLRLNYDQIVESCSIEKLHLYTEAFDNKRVSKLSKILIQKLGQ